MHGIVCRSLLTKILTFLLNIPFVMQNRGGPNLVVARVVCIIPCDPLKLVRGDGRDGQVHYKGTMYSW